MTKRLALLTIFLTTLLIGGGYASAFLPGGVPPIVTYVFAIAVAAQITAILVMGASRRGRPLGILWLVFAITFLVLGGGFVAALTLTSARTTSLWLGLPPGAAIIIYVVGLVPIAMLPIAYALTFEHGTLSDDELAALRRRIDELKSAE